MTMAQRKNTWLSKAWKMWAVSPPLRMIPPQHEKCFKLAYRLVSKPDGIPTVATRKKEKRNGKKH